MPFLQNLQTYFLSNLEYNFLFIIISFCIFLFLKFDFHSLFYALKVDPNAHGGQLVAKVLKDHNVSHIFTLIGGHISPIVVSAEELGIKIIDTRHEVTCVFAADAFARVSGKIGVAAVTAGPGVTNTITAVKNAQMAETPLLLLGGATASLLQGRGALQDIDQMSILKSLCKYRNRVTRVKNLVPVLREAIKAAYSGTPGPVFVELPLDMLYPFKFVKQEMKIKENPKTIPERIMNLYLTTYLKYQFANGFEEQDSSPLPIDTPSASPTDIDKCVSLIKESRKPVMVLGSQAMIPPSKAQELIKTIEEFQIPCFLGGMARGLLGRHHPLHIRQKRREALRDADLIILAGAVCDFRLSYGRVLNPQAHVISINRDKRQVAKNAGIFWEASATVQADVTDTLTKCLVKSQKDFSFDNDWLKTLRQRDIETEEKTKKGANKVNSEHLDPVHLLLELEKALPDNTILIADGGDFVATSSYILRPRGPLKWLDPGAFGTLGVGAGFALGVKACYPDSNVVILYGDGSCGYSIIEFDTFIRHKLPIVGIVGNDACWTQIAREQIPRFQSDVACNLEFTDYHKVVEALGGKGVLISGADQNNLLEKFQSAIDLSQAGHSVLVNALIGKTDFRSGSISI